jgi:hypothetical protein
MLGEKRGCLTGLATNLLIANLVGYDPTMSPNW